MAHIQASYFFQLTQEATIAIDEALVRTIISVTDKLQALSGRMDRFSNDDLSAIIDLCEK